MIDAPLIENFPLLTIRLFSEFYGLETSDGTVATLCADKRNIFFLTMRIELFNKIVDCAYHRHRESHVASVE